MLFTNAETQKEQGSPPAGVPRAAGGATLQGQQPVRGGRGGQGVPGHHAAHGRAHRAVPGQGPGPVHHGDWETRLCHEGSQGDRSSSADAGTLERLAGVCERDWRS